MKRWRGGCCQPGCDDCATEWWKADPLWMRILSLLGRLFE